MNSGIVLEKVAEYFYYSYKHRNQEDVPDMDIPPELCLELLMAADFLDSKSLSQLFPGSLLMRVPQHDDFTDDENDRVGVQVAQCNTISSSLAK